MEDYFVDEKTIVEIYTDGACSGNPGPGGWGVILKSGERELELSGGEVMTTNQRMEIKAAIEGLSALKKACDVTLYSDSAYLINCIKQKWYQKWQTNGWRNSNNEDVKNKDLWERLINLLDIHHVQFAKVKGHSGHHYNERCDELARRASQSFSRRSV